MASAVEIVISASDRASNVVAGISTSLTGISTTINSKVVPAFAAFGTAVISAAGVAKEGLSQVVDLIERTDRLLRQFANTTLQDVVTGAVQGLVNEISDASNYSLTTVLSAVGAIGKAATGLDNIAIGFDTQPIQDSAGQAKQSISQLFRQVATETAASVSQAAGVLANGFDRAFLTVTAKAEKSIANVQSALDTVSGAAFSLSGVNEVAGLFQDLQKIISPVTSGLAQVGYQIGQIQSVLGALNPIIASGPFNLLIRQNIQLREQVLATQGILASTNKVFQSGVQVQNPLESIRALQGPVEEAIKRIRQGSLELAGITSGQLIDSFQIVAGQAGALGINLNQAADLTVNLAAGLTGLGIPLYQARQEISSILTAQIDNNSVLAKAIGITNDQVRNYQTQGKLVEYLTQKLSGLRAGNAELSKTFSGVTSNIQEIVELIGLAAGQNLLDPIVAQLNVVYEYLKKNQDSITKFVTDISESLFGAVQNLVQALGSLFGDSQQVLTNSVRVIFDGITASVNALAQAIQTAAVIFKPFFDVLGSFSSIAPGFVQSTIQFAIQAKVLSATIGALTGGFERFAKGIPGLGDVLFLLEKRSSGLIGLLTGLTRSTNVGAAGFLTLGANLKNIPGLFEIAAKNIPVFGTQIAGLIPIVSQFGIAGIGAGQKFLAFADKVPVLKTTLEGLQGAFTGLVKDGGISSAFDKVAEFAKSNELLKPFAPTIEKLGVDLQGFAGKTDLAAVANLKFAETMKLVREQLITMALRLTVITAAVYLAFTAFDQFVLKNKGLIEVLSSVGQGLVSIGRDIKEFVTSPFGVATTAILGAVAALELFGRTMRAQVTQETAQGVFGGIRSLIENRSKGAAAKTASGAASAAGEVAAAGAFGILGNKVLGASSVEAVEGVTEKVAATGAVAKLEGFSKVFKALGESHTAEALGGAATKVAALSTAMGAGTAAAGGFAVALGSVARATALALGPLAIIAAGIALIGLVRYTKDLAEANEATAEYGKTTNRIADDAIGFAQGIKTQADAIKQAVKDGQQLTPEQQKQAQALRAQAQNRIDTIKDQITGLQSALKDAPEATKGALEGQIATLEASKKPLEDFVNDVQTAGDPIALLGNRIKYLDEQLKRLNGTIDASQKEQIAKLTENLGKGIGSQADAEQQKIEITRAGYEQQLKVTESGLNDLQSRFDKLSPQEKERAKDVQDAITKYRADAADLRTKIVESEIEEQQKKIDRAANDALKTSQAAETQRNIAIQKLKNQGAIDDSDAQQLQAESTKKRVNSELAIERERLAELSKNRAANSDAIKESNQKILDLTLQNLKAEEDAYNAYTARVKKKLDEQVTDRQIALQEQVNAGQITERQSAQQQAQLDVARLQAELAAETRNADKRRELKLQLVQAERKLQEANLEILQEALDKQTKAYDNQIKESNRKLQDQVGLYEAIGKALEVQTTLLNAQKDVLSAAESYVTGQFKAIGTLENSDRRRQQLSQATALIQLEALQQRQSTEQKIFEIQLEQNRLALERQKIENEIAESNKEGDIARGKAALLRADADLKAGKITKEEFDAIAEEQKANVTALLALQRQGSLIAKQQAIQPQQEAAARQKFALEQGSQQTDALVNFFGTLRPGQQARVRRPFQDYLARGAGATDSRSLLQEGSGQVSRYLNQVISGGSPVPGTDFFRNLTPRSQAISAALGQAGAGITADPNQKVQFGRQLQNAIGALDASARQVQLNNRPITQLNLPGSLPDIGAAQRQQQGGGITPQQIEGIVNAIDNRANARGNGPTSQARGAQSKIEAPITVNVTAPPELNQLYKTIGDQANQQISNVVQRATQLATGQ